MMPNLAVGWHWLVLALSLGGFMLLALASEREGKVLLSRTATRREKFILHLLGWPLLMLALGVCIWGWFGHFGTVLWFGWLTVAATTVVLAIAYWPGRGQPAPARRPLPSQEMGRERGASDDRRSSPAALLPQGERDVFWRLVLGAALALLPLAFGWALYHAPEAPLARPDVLHGQAGPWPFRLAEDRQGPPTLAPLGVPIKTWHLRFCEGCDTEIRAAYLKVHKPRSTRNAGTLFEGRHWDRRALVQLPSNTAADSELWLTVVGRDGTVHQVAWRMDEASPATVAWFTERQGRQ
ncbi:DUF3325 domain-containing protein [Pseudothauera nasutitermitis]|nr:DUF3325 domain-containing protein [Pseudothauera nasutitermitis]